VDSRLATDELTNDLFVGTTVICQRFSTSKLRAFEDLKSVATYGFRGEALASATYVSTLTITTQPKDSACAFRASYRDGKMVGKISKTAGLFGTIVTVEDLFYNDPQRLKVHSLLSPLCGFLDDLTSPTS